jgi:small subunit ribosomal protein S6
VQRDYELGFILNPEVSEEQTRAIMDRVEQVVSQHGGQIVRVNQWGRRRLAYPIEHHRDGFYTFVDMILTPETVIELERTLKVSEEVLRHLVKRRDPKTVQKEREARAAAAAAPAPTAPGTETDAAAADGRDEMVSPTVGAHTATVEELPASAPEEKPAVAAEEDFGDIPPALEQEDGVEA